MTLALGPAVATRGKLVVAKGLLADRPNDVYGSSRLLKKGRGQL
jgi:hypothetical protein